MDKTLPKSNPAPILELPDDLDALDELYKATSNRGERVICWLVVKKVRSFGALPAAEFRLWMERRQLAFSNLTDEERRTYGARIF